jgi:hypothetical protein
MPALRRTSAIRKVAYVAVLAVVGAMVALPAFSAEPVNRAGSPFVRHLSQSVQFHYYLTHPEEAPGGIGDRAESVDEAPESGAAAVPVGPVGARFNLDDTGTPQNEESVAVCPSDPKIVVSGTNDYRGILDPEFNFTGWYLSTDGGKSVAKEGLMPSVDISGTQTPSGGDPVIASDADCNLYGASLAYDGIDPFGATPNGVVMYKSSPSQLAAGECGDATDDQGFPIMSDPDCWDGAVAAETVGGENGHFIDKEWLAVGDTGDGEHVWVTYSDFSLVPADQNPLGFSKAEVFAVRCDADLGDCTDPILISENDDDVFFSQVTVGADGRTYVTWAGVTGELTDEPQTFIPKMRIAPAGSTEFGPEETITTLPQAIPFGGFLHAGDFRIASQPRLDVGTVNGEPREFVVFDVCGHRIGFGICENAKVRMAYSDDDGASWKFKRLSVGGGDSYFPTVAVDPETGKVAVAWFTNRFDRWGHRQDMELVTLAGGSLKVLDRQRLTSASNEPDADYLLGGVFIGDYIQVVAWDGKAYVAYNANYTAMKLLGEGPALYQQDNYLQVRRLG